VRQLVDGVAIAAQVPGNLVLRHSFQSGLDETANGTLVRWSGTEDAIYYNVVRGNLAKIRETDSAIDLGAVTCIELRSLDVDTSGKEDATIPAPGRVWFYLVESNNGWASSYGTAGVGKPRVATSGACE
jgi:hypothetical protein